LSKVLMNNTTEDNRVVITGIGAISSVGVGREAFWQALTAGHSGVQEIEQFDTAELPSHKAAWVKDFDPKPLIPRKLLRRLDRPTRLAAAATQIALDDAQLSTGEGPGNEIGLVLNTTFGPVSTNEKYLRTIIDHGPRLASPLLFPGTVTNAAAGYIAMIHKLRGPSSVVVGASGIAYAADLIRSGRAECVLAGSFEGLCETSYRVACELGFLATATANADEDSRPFDVRRNGFVLGEGATILVLESVKHATGRNARIYAEIAGDAVVYDSTQDRLLAFRSMDERLLARAMQTALSEAELCVDEVDAVIALAMSSLEVDTAEARALHTVFGARAATLPVSAIKSALGETVGMANAASIACGALTIAHGVIPPTINCEQRDPVCEVDCVPGTSRALPIRTVLCNSLELSGNNSVCVLTQFTA